MEKIRWGILATGWIAEQLAEAINSQPDAVCLAVGSRTQQSADKFGEQWDISRRYPTYEALAADPDVEVIYIATPHNLHYDNMKLCLNAGKHVLCEKPLTVNAAQAQECMALAQEKDLFLMEAMWMKFIPAIQQMQEWVANGRIGIVQLLQANFAFNIPFNPNGRLYDPALAGGALLDMGIYPATLAHLVLGKPARILSAAHLGETGVDELNTAIWQYADGAQAVLTSTQRLERPCDAFITGSQGYIKLHANFWHSRTLTFKQSGQEAEVVQIPYEGNGYGYQVREVHACLRAGKLESAVVTQADTLEIMTLLDEMRGQWGLVYPQELVA
ncbi:MAG: Gfo/Idh/MocA family oxidoreductase [Ardenticatenaceae bacterium]|nr:Gfo/Idh/MocA family oxidoreductase [Ardenticatenaceae bacterium]MCB8974964.1 Gfo/Idh/MocA family oxidoreductase [Ardenticatenaceae bacterium]